MLIKKSLNFIKKKEKRDIITLLFLRRNIAIYNKTIF